MKTLTELKAEYNNLIESTKGYVNDSKTFGFEPTELKQMQNKATELNKQILNFGK